MNIKRVRAALALALMTCFTAGMFSACSNAPASIPKQSNGYFREWNSLDDDVKHDVYAANYPHRPDVHSGGEIENGMWMTSWMYTKQRSTISCAVEKVSVTPGYYRFSAEAMISDNHAFWQGSRNFDIIAELRVTEAGSGKVVAFKSINRLMFGEKGKLEFKDITFGVAKAAKLNLYWCVKGSTYMWTNRLVLQGIGAESHVVEDLAEFIRDKQPDLQYRDEAMYYIDAYRYIAPLTDTRAAYDIVSMIVALQGIVNRDGLHLYINYTAPSQFFGGFIDDYWLSELTGAGCEWEGQEIVTVKTLGTLLRLFDGKSGGLAVWDEKVPATYNVACTAAGVDDLLPVRYDGSKYSLLSALKGMGQKVALDMYGRFTGSGRIWGTTLTSTKSPKCDAYMFAYEKYLKPGRTNPVLMAYHLDAVSFDFSWKESDKVVMYDDLQLNFLNNRDYYIARRAFFFDLSVYDDYIPLDDMKQPMGTDYKTLCKILETQNRLAGGEVIEIGGFTPWYVPKYVDGFNLSTSVTYPDAVATEWRMVYVLGFYNAVTHGDAHGTYGTGPFSNASCYSQIPKPQQYKQKVTKAPKPGARLENKNYVLFYMGDWDSSAWFNTFSVEYYFDDPRRGDYPLMWPWVPNIAERAPHVMNRVYERQTPNDYFVMGDDGWGYLDANGLISPERPLHSDGKPLNGTLESWSKRSKYEADKFDMDIMGFMITTTTPFKEVEEAYARVFTSGVFNNLERESGKAHKNLIDINNTPDNYDDDVPTMMLWGISDQDTEFSSLVDQLNSNITPNPTKPTFHAFRIVITSPTFAFNAIEKFGPEYNIEIMDPYTFLHLLKQNAINELLA